MSRGDFMKESYWIKHTKCDKHYPKVEQDLYTNIAIVGAGLTGLTTAYYTSKATSEIMIFESDQIGYGASGRNTGKITFQHGLLYHTLIEKYDRIFAKRYYKAQHDAMISIDAIIKEHHIDCEYQKSDAIVYTNDAAKVADIQDEYQAYLDLDIPCEYVRCKDEPTYMEAGLLIKDQAKFNPYAYCLGLSDILDEQQIQIYEHSALRDMKQKDDGYELSINGCIVHANKVVFTCQFPFIDHMHLYFARMRPIQESLCAAKITQKQSNLMIINAEKPMHSANIFEENIVMAGNQHKSGQGTSQQHEDFEKKLICTISNTRNQ